MLNRIYLRDVPLPDGLTQENIFEAMDNTQKFFLLIQEKTGINLSDIIQANNFSGVISNVFTKMLSDSSCYKSYHDQRYPDLMNYENGIGLEVKASNKPWKGGEGHNGHTGWHIIVCYKMDSEHIIEFIQAEIAYLNGYELENSDWHYQGSSRNENNSQRTETYTTTARGTAKLRDGSVYLNTDIVPVTSFMQSSRRRLEDELPIPSFSPFFRPSV